MYVSISLISSHLISYPISSHLISSIHPNLHIRLISSIRTSPFYLGHSSPSNHLLKHSPHLTSSHLNSSISALPPPALSRSKSHRRSSSFSLSPTNKPSQKRRDQNRVSQRAFRQRKEKHARELEARVAELEGLLETATRESCIVASKMSRMEGELLYYRKLLFSRPNASGLRLSSSNTPNAHPAAPPSSSSIINQFPDLGSFGAAPSLATASPSMATFPFRSNSNSNNNSAAAANDMLRINDALQLGDVAQPPQMAQSNDSCSTRAPSPASPQMFDAREPQGKNLDTSLWAYLQFNTSEPVVDAW
jgi:hypothetical protein